MTIDDLHAIIARGESLHVEFKEAKEKVPISFYDTVVSFLNREGGTIILGVNDEGIITGINKEAVERIKKEIVTTLNNKDVINPPVNFPIYQLQENGQTTLCLKIPVSSQIHSHNGIIYDRENDSDIQIKDDARTSELYFRKRNHFTENEIYPYLRLEDLDEKLFDKARTIIRAANVSHLFIEDDMFKTIIPLVDAVLGEERTNILLELVALDKSKLSPVTIEAIEALNLAPEYAETESMDDLIFAEGNSLGHGWSKKGVELFDKRTTMIFRLLLLCLYPQNIDEIQEVLGFGARSKLRDLYIKPLRNAGLFDYSIKDKPTSPNQKYVTTERGRRFLGGFDI